MSNRRGLIYILWLWYYLVIYTYSLKFQINNIIDIAYRLIKLSENGIIDI